jgi:diguanylate cyclase (GGDEF)-like protein
VTDKTEVDLSETSLDLTDKLNYDALTGIYSRKFMEEALARKIKLLSRADGLLSMLMIDVDFFKLFNDSYGQDEGDACLVDIANTLAKAIARKDDFIARYGGEEFVAILPYTNEYGAQVMANRMIGNVWGRNIPHDKNSATNRVTISIGGTTVRVKHTHKIDDYIQFADEALYASKQNGRNRYTHVKFVEG